MFLIESGLCCKHENIADESTEARPPYPTRDRIKAVIHASNNWSLEEITDALLIHETAVRQHIKDYLQSNKLKLENGGSKSHLS